MASFKEFFNKVNRGIVPNASTPALSDINKAISTGLNGIIIGSLSETEKFKEKVSNIVKSDEVISELSNTLGKPRKGETEDEFVARGKSILSRILMRKLSG